MKITTLTTYSPAIANRIRELLIQLSRSGQDKGEIPESWFKDIIASPYHDLLTAYDDQDQIVGVAALSIIMGPGVRKNAYLEDFVTDSAVRGQGYGSAMWEAMLNWAAEKGCHNLEFTSGHGRESAQSFYLHHGAEIYDTNFFRKRL